MSTINTKLLKPITAGNLKNYEGQIVLRTYHSLKLTADEFPKNGRTADDYDFVQEYVKITQVQREQYSCLTLGYIFDENKHLKKSEPQNIAQFNFYAPKAAGRKSFFQAINREKGRLIKEHKKHLDYLDKILADQ